MWNIKTFYNNQHKLTLIWFLNVQVAVHYYGRLAAKQGWRFDSTYDHKDETGEPIPFVFTLGSGKVSLMVFQFFFMCIPLISCLWVAKMPHVANTRHAMLMVYVINPCPNGWELVLLLLIVLAFIFSFSFTSL